MTYRFCPIFKNAKKCSKINEFLLTFLCYPIKTIGLLDFEHNPELCTHVIVEFLDKKIF